MGSGASKYANAAQHFGLQAQEEIGTIAQAIRALGAEVNDTNKLSKLLGELADQVSAEPLKPYDNRINAEVGLLNRFKDGTVCQLATFQQPGRWPPERPERPLATPGHQRALPLIAPSLPLPLSVGRILAVCPKDHIGVGF